MSRITEELERREEEVRSSIELYADLFDLDANLIRGLITQESRFVAEATSPTGAYGYGQFTGIGARQVQNIARMTEKAADLSDFTKADASNPDKGIKAIFATLWWLFNKKYHNVPDKKTRLEAVLTFYNSGGRPAALIVKHGGHANALPYLKSLPSNIRSQSPKYAPSVIEWFVEWYEHTDKVEEQIPDTGNVANPFDDQQQKLNATNNSLVRALLALSDADDGIDCIVNVRDGLTEITLIFPGELDL